ncbi:hypothetical protein BDV96DRAFT_693563 [Lophiotrema nucula]|uniref:Uncharacterized protein n=1 Tax=Lophiotrema nucula TaxID=690887 RepID=A0A6A5YJI8_9PLEO|nr:hypothetical protein BDV96DRAFT_693563 [Lophiotrema nucula]
MPQIEITNNGLAPRSVQPSVGNPALPAKIVELNADGYKKTLALLIDPAGLRHNHRRASPPTSSVCSAVSSSTYVSFDELLAARLARPSLQRDSSTIAPPSIHSGVTAKIRDNDEEIGPVLDLPHFRSESKVDKALVLEDVLVNNHVAAGAEVSQANDAFERAHRKLNEMYIATRINLISKPSPPTDLKAYMGLFRWFRRKPKVHEYTSITTSSRGSVHSVRSSVSKRATEITRIAMHASLQSPITQLEPGQLTRTDTARTSTTTASVKTAKTYTSTSKYKEWLFSKAQKLKFFVSKPSHPLPQTFAFVRSGTAICPRTGFPFKIPPIKKWNLVKAYHSIRYGIESNYKVYGIEDENWTRVSYKK